MAIVDTFYLIGATSEQPAADAEPKYKTADELWITPRIHEGLQVICKLLLSGELVHHPVDSLRDYQEVPICLGRGFNMKSWSTHLRVGDCGSVHCIAGWLFELGWMDYPPGDGGWPRALHPLFYPNGARQNWADITPAQGALAIHRFLQGRTDLWAQE